MLPTLTTRQKDIYDFLLKTIREKGYAPSIPEIGAKFKIASTNGVSDHLRALEKKGYIRRVGKRGQGGGDAGGRQGAQLAQDVAARGGMVHCLVSCCFDGF